MGFSITKKVNEKKTIDTLQNEANELGLFGTITKNRGVYLYKFEGTEKVETLGESAGTVRQSLYHLSKNLTNVIELMEAESLGAWYDVPRWIRDIDKDPELLLDHVQETRAAHMEEYRDWWERIMAEDEATLKALRSA